MLGIGSIPKYQVDYPRRTFASKDLDYLRVDLKLFISNQHHNTMFDKEWMKLTYIFG